MATNTDQLCGKFPRGKSWYLDWGTGPDRCRPSLGPVSEQEAETARVKKELELRTGQRSKVLSRAPLFDDFLVEYLKWHSLMFPDSHGRVAQICRDAFDDFRGKPLNAITKQDIELWVAKRQTRIGENRHGKLAKMSGGTASKEYRTLSAVLNRAILWGKGITESPCKNVAKPKSLTSVPIHWYEDNELAKLFKDSKYAAIWRLMANTGMRRGEAQHLKWTNVKKDVVQIISEAIARTKSGHMREVPLSQGAKEALAELKAMAKDKLKSQQERRAKGLKAPEVDEDDLEYVLPRMTPQSLSRAFLLDCERLGLKGSLHSLRHTYGAHMAMKLVTLPPAKLQQLMGHASLKTTEIYINLRSSFMREEVAKVSL